MSEETSSPETGAENATPELPAIANGGAENISKNPFPKAAAALKGFLERKGLPFVKGRGRPKNCPDCGGVGCASCGGSGRVAGKADKVLEPSEPAAASAAAPGVGSVVADQKLADGAATLAVAGGSRMDSSRADALFHRSVVKGAQGLIRGLTDYCKSLARQAGMDKEWVREQFDKAQAEKEDWDEFGESLGLVLEKYKVKTEYAPEIAAGISGCRILAPLGVLLVELRAEIRRKRMAEKSKV